jgi:hypothetical protein
MVNAWLSMLNQYERYDEWLISRSRMVVPGVILVVYTCPPVHSGVFLCRYDELKVVDTTEQSNVFCPLSSKLSLRGSTPASDGSHGDDAAR